MAGLKTEKSFIMIKPDGVERGLIGEIIKRFEQKGYKLVAMKCTWGSKDLFEEHYRDLKDKPFYTTLVEYMLSGPVVPMVWEGLDIVKSGRTLLGETDPKNSKPGTIRGDFALQTGRNIIHGSDSVESANREIGLWFKPHEMLTWKNHSETWVYEK